MRLLFAVFLIFVAGVSALFVAEHSSQAIATSPGTIVTVAGGGSGGDGGLATNAQLSDVSGIAFDPSGALYISDRYNCRVRKVSAGIITTVAGNGACGFAGDGGPATSAQLDVAGLAFDTAGNLFIADPANCRVRKVSGGIITTVAGSGPGNGDCSGSLGDGGPATSASLSFPEDVAVDTAGNLYIADPYHQRIRVVIGGIITTFAGNGTNAFSGDGGPATSASLYDPFGVDVDTSGNVFISDTLNCRVRRVSAGIITTVAGNGNCSYSGDGGLATNAELANPHDVAFDAAGNIYVADRNNCRVRKINAGVITTVAGSGPVYPCSFSGDGGPATSAELNVPDRLAFDGAGDLYIGEHGLPAASGGPGDVARVREVFESTSASPTPSASPSATPTPTGILPVGGSVSLISHTHDAAGTAISRTALALLAGGVVLSTLLWGKLKRKSRKFS